MCMGDYKRGLDWWLDLFTTYRSWLQVTTELSLIDTFYNSLKQALRISVFCVFTNRCLVMASNTVASSASVFTSLLAADSLPTN
jgi:hypothetical protein